MYTIDWASHFSGFRDDESLELSELVIFLNQYVANRLYFYETSNINFPSFIIDFNSNQIMHLLGIQYINNLSVTQTSKQLDKFINREWTTEYISNADNKGFKKIKERIENFPYIFNMLNEYSCEIKLLSTTGKGGAKSRKINMIFQQINTNKICQLELRETGENEIGKIYSPTSFTVETGKIESINRKLGAKFLPINIKQLSVYETQNTSKETIFENIHKKLKSNIVAQNEIAATLVNDLESE